MRLTGRRRRAGVWLPAMGGLAMAFGLAAGAHAKGQISPECQAERCAAQAAIDTACPCDSASNHGKYVSCVAKTAKALISKKCKGQVVRCAAQSTCGKSGFTTCQFTSENKCKILKDKICTKKGGTASGPGSCCPGCQQTTSTSSSTSSTTSSTIPVSPSGAFLEP